VIIDTPLGRLDSKHREKLREHYFPHASQQVIILSTDTEIDEDFYAKLERDISHSYQLEFDSVEKATVVNKGYFWRKTEVAA
jgi:DNA sulfur modification protein DndD